MVIYPIGSKQRLSNWY